MLVPDSGSSWNLSDPSGEAKLKMGAGLISAPLRCGRIGPAQGTRTKSYQVLYHETFFDNFSH